MKKTPLPKHMRVLSKAAGKAAAGGGSSRGPYYKAAQRAGQQRARGPKAG